MLSGTGFIDHVDGFVRQLPVVDVARRQFHRRAHRVVGVGDRMVLLEIWLQAEENFHAVIDSRLVHVDLLEPAGKRAVLLKVLTELFVCRRAHAAQFSALKRRLQKVRGIHRPAGGRARPDHGVDLVDKQDRVWVIFQLGDHRLQTFLEITAIARAGKQRAHVERVDRGALQHFRCFLGNDLARQAFRNRGFAHARIAHEKRVVLAAAAEHLHTTFYFVVTTDQWVHIALFGFRIKVDTIFGERTFFSFFFRSATRRRLRFFFKVAGAGDRAAFTKGRILGDAVRDEVHRVIPRHVLRLQEVSGVRLAFRENRDKHVCAGHFRSARGLDVDGRPLNDSLECCGRNRFRAFDFGHKRRQIVVDEIVECLAQILEVNRTGLHHLGGVRLVDQRQKQMLQRGKLVAARIGNGQRCVDGVFERFRK